MTTSTTSYVADEIGGVQAQIGRADTKASILTGLSLAALTGGTALATTVHLHGVAVATAITAAALIATALTLLGMAIRPDLRGNHGFVRWASAPTAHALWTQFDHDAEQWEYHTRERSFTQLLLLARSAHRKYQRIQHAVDLLGAALALAALTAILSGLGW